MNNQTQQRVNITLPRETLNLLDTVSKKGERSRVIDIAVLGYIVREGKSRVRKLLAEGARVRNTRDIDIAREWAKLKDTNHL